MEFKKYQHVERFGTTEVDGIQFGTCYLFPKLDGTNASVWLTEYLTLGFGSRNRELSLDNDNAGFMNSMLKAENVNKLEEFFKKYPDARLFGEWLVPHSLKTYKDSSWRKFYVFDVSVMKEKTHEGDSELEYIPYKLYKEMLEEFDINYIPPIAVIENPTYEQLVEKLKANNYLIEDGQGAGEGLVIKNYEWKNKYGRQTWAKIVTSEFKEKHAKTMGAPKSKGPDLVEQAIAEKYVTTALCEKVFSKIENETGWESKFIPRLLNTVYHDVVTEESWNYVKEHKNPRIDYKTLQHFVFSECKKKLPKVFGL